MPAGNTAAPVRRNPFATALLLAPALLLAVGVVAYPLAVAFWASLTDAEVGGEGHFIGLSNYLFLARDSGFRQSLVQTAVFTGVSTLIKALLGTALALSLASHFPGRRLVYALLCLPLLFPVAIGSTVWYFLLSTVHGGINYALVELGLIHQPIAFTGTPALAMASLIGVNVWHDTALFFILVLAAVQAIPRDLMESAISDGAGVLGRFLYLVLPLLRPALVLGVLLSLLGTFGDYAIVHLITGGGPAGGTHIVSSLAFVTALRAGDYAYGLAIALSVVPVYFAGLVYMLRLAARR